MIDRLDALKSDAEKVLIQWIRGAISDDSFPIIIANENGRSPSGEYASILLYAKSSKGTPRTVDVLSEDELTFDRIITMTMPFKASVQFYDGDAYDKSNKLMLYSRTNASKDLLAINNITISQPSTARDLTELLPAETIPRSQVDLDLQCSNKYVETIEAINEVDIRIN